MKLLPRSGDAAEASSIAIGPGAPDDEVERPERKRLLGHRCGEVGLVASEHAFRAALALRAHRCELAVIEPASPVPGCAITPLGVALQRKDVVGDERGAACDQVGGDRALAGPREADERDAGSVDRDCARMEELAPP